MTEDVLGKILSIACAAFWGLAVILFKLSGETIRPLALNLYKSIVSFILFIPLILIVSPVPRGVSGADFLALTLSGVLGVALADTLGFMSLNILGAGLTAIVDCMYSPILIGMSVLFLSETMTLRQVAGCILVVAAVLVSTLRIQPGAVRTPRLFLGIFYGLGALLMLSVGVIFMKPVLHRAPLMWVMELRLAAATIALGVIVWFHPERPLLLRSITGKQSWKLALPGTILGNFLSMGFWIAGFKFTDLTSAAILNQTGTIFIALFAAVFLKERFGIRKVLGVALGFVGALLVIAP